MWTSVLVGIRPRRKASLQMFAKMLHKIRSRNIHQDSGLTYRRRSGSYVISTLPQDKEEDFVQQPVRHDGDRDDYDDDDDDHDDDDRQPCD